MNKPLWGTHRPADHCNDLLPAQAQIHSVHNARLLLLKHHWNLIFSPLRVTAECLCWDSRSSMIWLPSTFLGLSSALLNGPCALASQGYLLLPVWAWIYYVLDSSQPFFYVSTGAFSTSSSALHVLSSRLPCMAMLVISCPRVLVKGIEWWQKSRLPSSSCATTDCFLIHTEVLYELALPWEAA